MGGVMRNDLDPNYAVTALALVALVVVAAIVVLVRPGSDARFEYERSDRTGSVRMRGAIEAPRPDDKQEPKKEEPVRRSGR